MNNTSSKVNISLLIFIIFFAFIQFVIIQVAIMAFDGNVPVSESNTVTYKFKADKVEYRTMHGLGRHSGRERNIFYYYNSDRFSYPDLFSYQYDGDSVAKDLEKEYLTVTCKKGTNTVVALKGENITFYTLKDYNFSKTISTILGIIVMLILESGYLFIVSFLFLFYYVPPYMTSPFAKIKSYMQSHIKKQR